MDRYLIIADDFTGANDTGVQLKRRGLRTSVIFAGRKPPEDEGCVVKFRAIELLEEFKGWLAGS